MFWLIITIFAYFILAIVYLVDKYLLKESIPNPKIFAFYVGILGISSLVLIPFVGFYVPKIKQIILALSAGAFLIYGLFWFYRGLRLFEASRIVTAVGGLSPLFSFGLIYLFSFGKESLSLFEDVAFILLICGSVLITLGENKDIALNFIEQPENERKEQKQNISDIKGAFKISVIAAFFFSLSFVLTKYVYLAQPFWNGFIWTKLGGVLAAFAFFLFAPEIRKRVFKKRKIHFEKKTVLIFFSGQLAGAGAGILQNWAIALAPLIYVAFISALQGIQYLFLFVFTIFLSLKFPKIIKEEISKKIIFQKIFAILSICLALAILVLK